jgi:hypothetical protein
MIIAIFVFRIENIDTLRHSVVVAVRTPQKAEQVKKTYEKVEGSRLKTVLLSDVCQLHDCIEAIKSEPSLDAVIHAGSPFTFDVKNIKKV